jgi:mannose-6-phosphate isomerase-like protein (cupin superfamily)
MSSQSYVLDASEGEQLVRSAAAANPSGGAPIPGGGAVCIKADPGSGSSNMSVGTQHVPTGVGIRVHRHHKSDEVIHVLDGTGIVTLGDQRVPIAKGSTLFICKGTWHGFENPDGELELLWVVSPPGLEGYFRDIGSPPGAPPKHVSLAELNEIARRHDQEFR